MYTCCVNIVPRYHLNWIVWPMVIKLSAENALYGPALQGRISAFDAGPQSHRLRRLRWPVPHDVLAAPCALGRLGRHGLRFEIDDAKADPWHFLDCVEAMEDEEDLAKIDRPDFVIFAAGLVLRAN